MIRFGLQLGFDLPSQMLLDLPVLVEGGLQIAASAFDRLQQPLQTANRLERAAYC